MPTVPPPRTISNHPAGLGALRLPEAAAPVAGGVASGGGMGAPLVCVSSLAGAGWLTADLTSNPAPIRTLALGLAGGVLVSAVSKERDRRRRELEVLLARAAAGQIGTAPEASVTGRRWEGRWVGLPRQLVIRYDPRAESSPEWEAKVCDAIARRLDRPVVCARHDKLRCSLVLDVRPPKEAPADAPVPELAERAEKLLQNVFGAKVHWEATWDEQTLRRLDVAHDIGIKISPNPLVRSRIEKTVNAMLPGRWRARWDLEADTVIFEPRPEFPPMLERVLDPVTAENARVVPFGRDEDGQEVVWDLRSSAGQPHFLCVGKTGSGKTVLMRTLVVELTRREYEVWVCDPKRVEFIGMKSWPNVGLHASSVPAIVAAIHAAKVEMERRYALIEQGKASEADFSPLFLLLDEYRYFYGIANAWWASVKPKGAPRTCPIFEEVFLIASLGRTAEVHLILGTQRPDADWLGGDVRDQFAARASLGRLSPDGAKMAWGAYHIGVSVPLRTPGRGTAVSSRGVPAEFQSYWTPDPVKASAEDLEILAALRPSRTVHERKVVLPVPPLYGEDGEALDETGRYEEYATAPIEPLSAHPHLADYSPDPLTSPMPQEPHPPSGGEEQIEEPLEATYDEMYAPPQVVTAGSLLGCEGHLIQVDPQLDIWAVIETVEDDAVDEGEVCICWRSDEDGGDYGVLVLGESERLEARAPKDDTSNE